MGTILVRHTKEITVASYESLCTELNVGVGVCRTRRHGIHEDLDA